MESIDEYVVRTLPSLRGETTRHLGEREAKELTDLFRAQVQSRHLDLAARWLQARGKGYYTIGSAGHESNAALGLVSRTTDPALLHYRSGGFYAARAAVAGMSDGIRPVLQSLVSSRDDPMSGGRHKVFGHPQLSIIPQTSTIGSHLPRAVGLAFAIDAASGSGVSTPWPTDSVVICSFGDASANHSTVVGAMNAASYLAHRSLGCPILFVCEDNRIGISTPSPDGWPGAMLRSVEHVEYFQVAGTEPVELLATGRAVVEQVRKSRAPAVLHLRTVRLMGHAGSDAEIAYRTQRQILGDYEFDPVVATAQALLDGEVMDGAQALDLYERSRAAVMTLAEAVLGERQLSTRDEVVAPLMLPTAEPAGASGDPRAAVVESGTADAVTPMTLAQSINAALVEALENDPSVIVFGEDVGVKGGVYGVTRGLRRRFGGQRVFDTLLDEQTILGLALGAASAGFTPIPEIQYLAYLHNAEDQLRGEAASLQFFSAGQYHNGMVVRIAGLAYQRGFGGHFHNDNSLAVLRDIPGIVVGVPAHPADAPGMLRTCLALARDHGKVCVLVEPIARYHSRDLHADDGAWMAPYRAHDDAAAEVRLGQVRAWGTGGDLAIVTFGNGTYLSLGAVDRLARLGIDATVVDIRWVAPVPRAALVREVASFSHVLIADETRSSGGVGEALVAALVEEGYAGRLGRVASADSFIPLGPASDVVLLSEAEIVHAARRLLEQVP